MAELPRRDFLQLAASAVTLLAGARSAGAQGYPSRLDKLSKEINAGLADSTLQARFDDLGIAPMPKSPIEFGKLIAEETEKWGKVVKFAGIKLE
jgi:hypothetical protein